MAADTVSASGDFDAGAGQAFIAELESASQSLKEVHQEMRERFVELKGLADEWAAIPERELAIAVEHAQEAADTVREAFNKASSDLEATVEASAEELAAHFDTFVEETRTQFDAWETTFDALNQACDQFLEQCQSATDTAATGMDQFKQEVEALQSMLQEVAAENVDMFSEVRQTLTGQWTSDMTSTGNAWIAEISGPHTQRATQHFDNGRQQFEQLRSALEQALHELGSDFDNEIRSAFDNVTGHVEQRAQSGLRDAGERVLDSAVERMGMEVVEGIIMSTIGAQTTTAMTPVLPYLIVIKKISDVIIQAIRTWKELKSGFGLFG